jgi:hypothetical protein
MSWFPHFLNPIPALIGAALSVPALLLLYFLKLRRRSMDVPSTLLWRKAIQDLQVNAPIQRLRRNLLLFLQLLLLLLLLLALSRPVTNYRPSAGKATVFLIDRSASMSARDIDGRSRLDEAKRRARELVGSMGRHATAMVIAFDDSARTVQTWTTDANALRNAIDSITPSDRRSRLKLAYQLAEGQGHFNPDQPNASDMERFDIRLFSDGRVLDDPADLSIHENLIFEKIGTDTAHNVGIVALNARRNYERPTEVQVFARLANFGPDPVDVPVQLSVDGEVVGMQGSQTRNVFLLPDRCDNEKRDAYQKGGGKPAIDSVEFQLDLTSSAVITLEQMLTDGEMLAADDVAQVVVPPPKTLEVCLVTGGNYFLERAINSLGLQKPVVMSPGAYEKTMPTEFDVILFDRYAPKKLPPTGSYVYFLDGPRAALPADLKVKVSKDSNGQTMVLKDVGVLDWKRDHPILHELAMSKLYVAEAAKLEVPDEAQVLLDGLKGPLIVLDREKKGTHLVVAFDVLQSNWPLKVSFPMFLQNAMQYLAVGSDMDVRHSYQPGEAPVIPRSNLQKLDPTLTSITLTGPSTTVDVPIPATGDFALPPLERVGIYSTKPAIPQFQQIAVNLLDPNESNLMPSDAPPGDANAAVEEVKDSRARLELWWWLALCGALPLLMIEWYVYTRRVHL